MLLEIILFLVLGILAGTFSGLVPGIHINLVGAFLVSVSIYFSGISPIYFVVFIVAMAIAHTFVDFIPSILLGCPDTDTELSILPGHELLKKGYGYEAILLTAYGGLSAIFLLILTAFPLTLILIGCYNWIKFATPYLLIILMLFLIFTEKKKFNAFLSFTITGLLGLCVLNLQPEQLNQPLLPLLTGLFGASSLILSIKQKAKIPSQKITKPKIKDKIFGPLIGALIASPFCGFLPGLGSGEAATLGNTIVKTDRKGFLVLLGAVNILVMGFSFISLYAISKSRTGAAVAIQSLVGQLSLTVLILILITCLVSGVVSFFVTKFLSKKLSNQMNKINYAKLSIATLIFLIIIVFVISGFFGLFILILSTLTGIYCINLKVKRTLMMGCLLIPVIVWYLF
jgi:putative membrane protein